MVLEGLLKTGLRHGGKALARGALSIIPGAANASPIAEALIDKLVDSELVGKGINSLVNTQFGFGGKTKYSPQQLAEKFLGKEKKMSAEDEAEKEFLRKDKEAEKIVNYLVKHNKIQNPEDEGEYYDEDSASRVAKGALDGGYVELLDWWLKDGIVSHEMVDKAMSAVGIKERPIMASAGGTALDIIQGQDKYPDTNVGSTAQDMMKAVVTADKLSSIASMGVEGGSKTAGSVNDAISKLTRTKYPDLLKMALTEAPSL